MENVRLRLLILCLLPALHAQPPRSIKLPVQAVELRFQQGRFLALAPVAGRQETEIRVLDRDGRELRRALAAPPPGQGFRGLTVRDATLAQDGRILLAVSLTRSLGESRNGILELFPDGVAPLFRDLDGLICHRILAEGKGAWCLGLDLAKFVRQLPLDVLYRLGPDFNAVPMLPLEKLGVRRRAEGGFTGPWSASEFGPPMLFTGAPGAAWVWMPNVTALARADLDAGRVDLENVPLRRAGRSFVSLAATASGRVFGLFPLRGQEEETEALDTRYGFFEREAGAGRWRIVPKLGDAPRGAQLIGAEGESLLIWLRPERRVEWREIGSRFPD